MIDSKKMLEALDTESLEILRDGMAQSHKMVFEEIERRKSTKVTS